MIVLSPPEATGELIGRNDEIAQVDAVLDRVRDSGGALLIRGAPGIGKSALLDRARGRASALSARALVTVGVESESELAFAGLHQLLAPIGSRTEGLPDPQRQALDAAFVFLSHRTIGSHLYRTFPKLGITARAQLRAALQPRPDETAR